MPVFSPQAERHEARVGIAIHTSLKANTSDRGDLREEDVRGLIALAGAEAGDDSADPGLSLSRCGAAGAVAV